MDLGLNETQQMLKNSARDMLAENCPLNLVRDLEDANDEYPEELWRQMADLG